jgi:hypothetical protein
MVEGLVKVVTSLIPWIGRQLSRWVRNIQEKGMNRAELGMGVNLSILPSKLHIGGKGSWIFGQRRL